MKFKYLHMCFLIKDLALVYSGAPRKARAMAFVRRRDGEPEAVGRDGSGTSGMCRLFPWLACSGALGRRYSVMQGGGLKRSQVLRALWSCRPCLSFRQARSPAGRGRRARGVAHEPCGMERLWTAMGKVRWKGFHGVGWRFLGDDVHAGVWGGATCPFGRRERVPADGGHSMGGGGCVKKGRCSL